MKYYELDKIEEQLLEQYEKGDFKSIAAKKSIRNQYTTLAQKSLEKTRNVNIRIAEGDV